MRADSSRQPAVPEPLIVEKRLTCHPEPERSEGEGAEVSHVAKSSHVLGAQFNKERSFQRLEWAVQPLSFGPLGPAGPSG